MSGMQAQCWFCPICFEDSHHEPGGDYCIKKQAEGYRYKQVENDELRARVFELELAAKADEPPSVPDAEYIRALQYAFDIIQADANTEQNYGSFCRIGGVLAKLKAGQEKAQ